MTLTSHGQALLIIIGFAVLIGGATCATVWALLLALGTPASRIEGDGP